MWSPGPSGTWYRSQSRTRSILNGGNGGFESLPILPGQWPLVVYERSKEQFEVVQKILIVSASVAASCAPPMPGGKEN